jgi:hypothetical protein
MRASLLLAGCCATVFAGSAARTDAAILTFSGAASGGVNGLPISATHSASGDTTTGHKSTDMGPISSSLGSTMKWVSSYNTGDLATDFFGALNCVQLTNGNFTRTTTAVFPTGEVLTIVRTQQRTSSTTFSADDIFSGTMPVVPNGSLFQPLDYDILFTQLDAKTLRYTLNNSYLVDLNNDTIPDPVYTVTGTIDIAYDGAVQLPFDEMLHGRLLSTSYDPASGNVHYESTTSISPVPEPASMAGLFIVGALLARRGRRWDGSPLAKKPFQNLNSTVVTRASGPCVKR